MNWIVFFILCLFGTAIFTGNQMAAIAGLILCALLAIALLADDRD